MQRYSGGLQVPKKMTELFWGLTTNALSLIEVDLKYAYIGESLEFSFPGMEEETTGLFATIDSEMTPRRIRVMVRKYQALALGDVTHAGVGADVPINDLVVDYMVRGM